MTELRTASYARVSSEHQAQAQTIASQVAALRERVAADGLRLLDELVFIDDGFNGASLVRPALERLRDVAAAATVRRREPSVSSATRRMAIGTSPGAKVGDKQAMR